MNAGVGHHGRVERPSRSPRAIRRPAPPAVAAALLACLALVGGTGPVAGVSPIDRPDDGTPVTAAARDPLPRCRYADLLTRFHDPSDWRRTLLDTTRRLPRDYAAPGLVPVATAGVGGAGLIRQLAVPDLRAMARAARRAGAPFAVRSAWRSWEMQAAVFAGWVRRTGRTEALRYSARPGHSEHQLGLALDLMSATSRRAPWIGDFGATKAGRWLARHAWAYGWVMSYPKGQTQRTCYGFEPWHFRYLGREAAAAIHAAGVTARVWLWRTSEGVR